MYEKCNYMWNCAPQVSTHIACPNPFHPYTGCTLISTPFHCHPWGPHAPIPFQCHTVHLHTANLHSYPLPHWRFPSPPPPPPPSWPPSYKRFTCPPPLYLYPTAHWRSHAPTPFECHTVLICKLSYFQEKISDSKDHITELIRENTNRLDQLNMLLGEKRDYETQLDSRQKNLVSLQFTVFAQ